MKCLNPSYKKDIKLPDPTTYDTSAKQFSNEISPASNAIFKCD